MWLDIHSVHNPRVKQAARLRERRGRQQQARILIEGAREILRAIDAGLTIEELFVRDGGTWSAETDLVVERCGAATRIRTTPEVFDKLAVRDAAVETLAIAPLPVRRLEELALPEQPLIAVLQGIEKPGNVGAILRSADGAGVDAVVIVDPVTDLYNPNCVRASLGAVFTVPVVEASSAATRAWLRAQGIGIVAARVDGAVDYWRADLSGPVALVLGSEAEGLTSDWSGEGVTAVRLPQLGQVDSLNVSATAAVLFYEARRQRGVRSGE